MPQNYNIWTLPALFLATCLLVVSNLNCVVESFRPPTAIKPVPVRSLYASKIFQTNDENADNNNDSNYTYNDEITPEDAFDLARFQRRQRQLQRGQQSLPPHPSLGPRQVVTALLEELRSAPYYYSFDPLKPRPHPGVQPLWQASTPAWQQTMAAMVGRAGTGNLHRGNNGGIYDNANNASQRDQENNIISALGRFLARPNQQFGILMGLEDASFQIDFPTDVVEWSDDEAWLECRLRAASNNDDDNGTSNNNADTLLVVLGWTLQRKADGCWYIHAFDWQDFRNDYRPGIGREEWERICG